ncbi:ERF family protein [Gallibacterium anatis]|uniref:ERF family protein n=1 Tax=Gallibacterium anatis TaxID=750 RepID=UPI001E505FCC|nr:ERF family protein [Gallibacterium anatis]
MMSSVYQKLAQARVELRKKNLKKSGKNKHTGFEYFELGDFLPEINNIFNEIGLCGVISFTSELATLTIYNVENDEKIVFTSPMAPAEVRGCQPIQNLGAVQTYQRRYLYLTALEIVESDQLDPDVGNPENQKPKQVNQVNTPAKNAVNQNVKPSKEEVWQKFLTKTNSITSIEALDEHWNSSDAFLSKNYPDLREAAYAAYVSKYSALEASEGK